MTDNDTKIQDIEASDNTVDEVFLTEEELILQKVRKKQIAKLRNKVYIFFLALFLFMGWPTFLEPIEKVRGEGAFKMFTANPIEGMHRNRGKGGLLQEIDDKNAEIEEKEKEIEKTEIEKEVVKHLIDEKKQNKIINCLNFDVCGDMSDELQKQLDFLRIFLMVGGLTDTKMSFDQKKVLRNLNEYMLTSPQGESYGNLLQIKFLGTQEVSPEYKLNKLGINLEIEFLNKESLFAFLNSMENKIYVDTPVMYVIDTMNYDVVNYDEPQIVGVKVDAYFFTGDIEPKEDDMITE